MKITVVADNTIQVKKLFGSVTDKALEAIGMQASSHAAEGSPVKTGRLRDSMTYELGDKCVYIGTNVEYGIYQELGTKRGVEAKHMIRNAATNHTAEYMQILTNALKQNI